MKLAADNLFRALADLTRLRCLMLLHHQGELCVCELTHALKLAQPKVSRHLALLRESGVVSDRRQGLWVYYQLNTGLPDWARRVLDSTAAGTNGQRPFRDDLKRLSGMADRPQVRCAS